MLVDVEREERLVRCSSPSRHFLLVVWGSGREQAEVRRLLAGEEAGTSWRQDLANRRSLNPPDFDPLLRHGDHGTQTGRHGLEPLQHQGHSPVSDDCQEGMESVEKPHDVGGIDRTGGFMERLELAEDRL